MDDRKFKFISILRGINVGGKKKILMSDLKKLYEGLGLSNVKTFIQSGNVIFDYVGKKDENYLCQKIADAILSKFNFNVPVIIRTFDEMEKIIAVNPFLEEQNADISKLHVTFLSEKPMKPNTEILKSNDYLPDKFSISGKEIYILCASRYSECKLSNNILENKLKVTATTRNWKTVNKIFELANLN